MIAGLLGLAVRPAAAQVAWSTEAIEEIQSIAVRADVSGNGVDPTPLARMLEEVVRQELRRADILWERSEPRAGDCCILRLDVRVTTGSGRARFGIAYIVRMELGYGDRLGNLPTWTVVWAGRQLSNIVERVDLEESLRGVAHDLAGNFVDLYRERFPR